MQLSQESPSKASEKGQVSKPHDHAFWQENVRTYVLSLPSFADDALILGTSIVSVPRVTPTKLNVLF